LAAITLFITSVHCVSTAKSDVKPTDVWVKVLRLLLAKLD